MTSPPHTPLCWLLKTLPFAARNWVSTLSTSRSAPQEVRRIHTQIIIWILIWRRKRYQDPWPRCSIRSPRTRSLRYEDWQNRGRYPNPIRFYSSQGRSPWSSSLDIRWLWLWHGLVSLWMTTTREDGSIRLAPIHTQNVTLQLFSSAVEN